MRELKRIDKVAYVRFASVYRSFEDVDEFRQLIRENGPRGLPGTSLFPLRAGCVRRHRVSTSPKDIKGPLAPHPCVPTKGKDAARVDF